MTANRWAVCTAGLFAIVIIACAGGPPVDKTLQAEEMLGTAGFALKSVATQAQGERLAKLPQKKVVRFASSKGEVYLWADIYECRCYYRGTTQNYENLVALRKEAKSQQRINWYDAQDNDPLWGNAADWEDALLLGD